MKGYAAEHLAGSAACLQALRLCPRFLWLRYRGPNGGLPMPNLNPFSKGHILHGNYRQIFSENVPNPKPDP
jgi:hypothetical protein